MTDPAVPEAPAGDAIEAAHPRGTVWPFVPLVACWLLAAWPPFLWLVATRDPELAVRLAQLAWTATSWALAAFLGAGGILVLAFPPAWAGLRLAASRLRAKFATDRGPLLEALARLRHFESAAAHLEVGRLALSRGELRLAAEHLHRALELEPDLPSANYLFGGLLARTGQVVPARTLLLRAENLDPGHAFGGALLEAGRCALMQGDFAGALELLERHARSHGGGRRARYLLGKARAGTGDREGAIEAMREAAAPPEGRLPAEEAWFRSLARVWLWRHGGPR